MIRTLIRIGNAHGFIIPAAIIESMGADEKTPFRIDVDGHRLVISPAAETERKKFGAATSRGLKNFDKVFRRLGV